MKKYIVATILFSSVFLVACGDKEVKKVETPIKNIDMTNIELEERVPLEGHLNIEDVKVDDKNLKLKEDKPTFNGQDVQLNISETPQFDLKNNGQFSSKEIESQQVESSDIREVINQ